MTRHNKKRKALVRMGKPDAAEPGPPGFSADLSNVEASSRLTGAAGNPEADPGSIGDPVESADYSVRMKAAGNPATAPEDLAKLALEPDEWVRSTVAANPSISPELHKTLAESGCDFTREGAARNPKAPPELIARFARDGYSGVREMAAENPLFGGSPKDSREGQEPLRPRLGREEPGHAR